jgi:hypothetical protein
VGTQQRSGPHYQKARELVRSGHIGRVVAVRMWYYRNVMPGFGSPPDGDPPPGLDYDLWLGPRRSGPITRTERSTTSDGSGIIRAGR